MWLDEVTGHVLYCSEIIVHVLQCELSKSKMMLYRTQCGVKHAWLNHTEVIHVFECELSESNLLLYRAHCGVTHG